MNAQLLGGKLSFFQSLSVLGYSLAPLVLAAALGWAWGNPGWRAVTVVVGWAWAARAAVVFVSPLVPPARRALALYPVVLFLTSVAWLVFVGA